MHALGLTDPSKGYVNWLGSEKTALGSLIVMSLWGIGGGMVIYLAGLQGIPQSYYEAASLDGATVWQRFRHVTLPLLTPTIFFTLIIGVIGSFQVFTQGFVMTQGGAEQRDPVLRPIPLPERLPVPQNGLRQRPGLGAVPDHLRLHRLADAGFKVGAL